MKYVTPSVDVVVFHSKDIIVTSGCDKETPRLSFDDLDSISGGDFD